VRALGFSRAHDDVTDLSDPTVEDAVAVGGDHDFSFLADGNDCTLSSVLFSDEFLDHIVGCPLQRRAQVFGTHGNVTGSRPLDEVFADARC